MTSPTALPMSTKAPTRSEFDGAFLRLLERAGGLSWQHLQEYELDHLALLAKDSPGLLKWDQEVLRDWACAKGICVCDVYRQPNAPVIYMARLLIKQGVTCIEDFAAEYPGLVRAELSGLKGSAQKP